MSEEYDEISRLMRLKRYEKPPEDFYDSFLQEFQQRQRSELLNRSARGLVWERVSTYFSDFGSMRMAFAGAAGAAACLVGGGLFLAGAVWSGGDATPGSGIAAGGSSVVPHAGDFSPAASSAPYAIDDQRGLPRAPVPVSVGAGSVQPVSAQLNEDGQVIFYREF